MLKKSTTLFLLIVCCLFVEKTLAGELTIATYNVRNLFDNYKDPYINDKSRENGTTAKPKKEVEALAKVIKKLNADVIALQEVENRGTLESFNQKYLKDLGYKEIVLIEGNNSHVSEYSRGIDVAVMSRVPVSKVSSYQNRIYSKKGYSQKYSRDLLQVTLTPKGFPKIDLFVLHAPSKRGENKAYYQRVEEAKKSIEIIEEQFEKGGDDYIIVTGDFNDDAASKSLSVYTGSKKIPLKRMDAKDKKGRQYSWYGMGKSQYPPDTFDHILVSPALQKNIKKSYVWNESIAAVASDHRPVVITIKNDK